jgi:hypothetical protein
MNSASHVTSRKETLAGLGVLDEPHSDKPTERSSHTGGYMGWTRFHPMLTGGPVWLLRSAGLADYKVRLKLPPLDSLHTPSVIYLRLSPKFHRSLSAVIL